MAILDFQHVGETIGPCTDSVKFEAGNALFRLIVGNNAGNKKPLLTAGPQSVGGADFFWRQESYFLRELFDSLTTKAGISARVALRRTSENNPQTSDFIMFNSVLGLIVTIRSPGAHFLCRFSKQSVAKLGSGKRCANVADQW